jgi:hypothetical protein
MGKRLDTWPTRNILLTVAKGIVTLSRAPQSSVNCTRRLKGFITLRESVPDRALVMLARACNAPQTPLPYRFELTRDVSA